MYEQIFKDDDIESSFVYMLSKLKELWSGVEFSNLLDACLWDMRLSDEVRNNLSSAKSLKGIFDLLSKTHFCTWLEIRILGSMAKVAGVLEAIRMIDIFKQCVHYRKCSEVKKHFKEQYINPNHYKKVNAKLNKDARKLFVADLIEYCHNLEGIIKLPKSSALMTCTSGCLEVSLVIPECLHLENAYEMTRKNYFLKLRPFNIQYLQIGSLPKVYTTDLMKTTEANLLLTKILSRNDCKFININK